MLQSVLTKLVKWHIFGAIETIDLRNFRIFESDLNLIQKESEKVGPLDNDGEFIDNNLFGPEDQTTISDKDAVICQSFSENNYHVVLSNENRSVKSERLNENHRGYCFLEHPKLSNMDILIWTLKISKFKIGDVGKVVLNII